MKNLNTQYNLAKSRADEFMRRGQITQYFEALLENIKNYPNIIPLNFALWHSETVLSIDSFAQPDNTSDKFSFYVKELSNSENRDQIHAYSISQLMKLQNVKVIDILIMDIEGGEKEIFSQNNGWLEYVRYIAIEIHPGCWKAVFEAISKFDYDCSFNGENLMINLNNTISND